MMKLINIRDTYVGASWCMSMSPTSHLMAIGGDDGSVRLFDTDDMKLDYESSLPTCGARVFSLCFHPSLQQLFTGCSDGTIRCYDLVSIHSATLNLY